MLSFQFFGALLVHPEPSQKFSVCKRWTGISPETHPYKDATSSQDQLLATHRNRQANHLGQQHFGGQKLPREVGFVATKHVKNSIQNPGGLNHLYMYIYIIRNVILIIGWLESTWKLGSCWSPVYRNNPWFLVTAQPSGMCFFRANFRGAKRFQFRKHTRQSTGPKAKS